MRTVNEKYEIRILKTPHYRVDSVDNKPYDMCIQACKADIVNGHHASYEMRILSYDTGEEVSIVLLCSYCTQISEHSGILTDDTIYVLLDRQILEMNLKDYSFQIYDIQHPFGTYYEMYDCEKEFLIYGELELLLLDNQMQECWRYATQDMLFGRKPLTIEDGRIKFTDYAGNYHEVNMLGKLLKYEPHATQIVTVNMAEVKTPKEFQLALKKALNMPDFYGMNWDAYWDSITGLITMPDMLILEGWHIYKTIQREDAKQFEAIMKAYDELDYCKHCECVYKYWI